MIVLPRSFSVTVIDRTAVHDWDMMPAQLTSTVATVPRTRAGTTLAEPAASRASSALLVALVLPATLRAVT